MQLHHSVLLLAFLGASTEAWVTPPPSSSNLVGRSITTTTQLYMFDWFNPKPKTSSTKEEKEEKKDDFLGNFFNFGHSTPAPTKSTADKVVQETMAHQAAAVVEAPTPVETVKEEVKVPPPAADEKVQVEKESTTTAAAVTTPAASEATTTAAAPSHKIHHGRVKWFDRRKGYGLIEPVMTDEKQAKLSKRQRLVFVHQSDLQCGGFRYLYNEEEVEYGQEMDDQGRPKAVHVTGPNGGDLKITAVRKHFAEEGAAKKE